MLVILLTLVPVFGIMFLGAVAYRQQILPANVVSCLNQFIYWYSLPMLLFYLMASVELTHINVFPVFGAVLGMLAVQILGTGLLYWGKCSWSESLVGGLTVAFPNVAFMGLPTIMLLYPGDNEAKAMAGLVALAPTASLVLADVLLSLQGKGDKRFFTTLRNIIHSLYTNPALIGTGIGMLVSFGEVSVPQGILHMAEMLGSASAPCALFCMGMSVAGQISALKQGRLQRGVAKENSGHTEVKGKNVKKEMFSQTVMIGLKLFITPLLVYAFGKAMGATGVSLATMVVLSSMPSAITTHIIAVKYHALEDGCARAVLIGTLFSVGTMPLVIHVLQ